MGDPSTASVSKMTDFIDIKTLVVCYGLCCCTQLVAFILQYRINKGGQGIQWWIVGSVLMVFGFFMNSFRDVESLASIAIFIRLRFCFVFCAYTLGLRNLWKIKNCCDLC